MKATNYDARNPAAVVQLLAIGPGNMDQNLECSATGFFVNEEGYLLTNAHVVEKGRDCMAKSPGARLIAKLGVTGCDSPQSAKSVDTKAGLLTGKAISCEVVGLDDAHDLAVMKTDRPPPMTSCAGATSFVELDAQDLVAGTPVEVSGHPALAWTPETHSGRIIGRRNLALFEPSHVISDVLILDIPLHQGSSGSPVFRSHGGVVGVVERQNLPNRSQTLAVPIHYACDLLDRLGVKWRPSPR